MSELFTIESSAFSDVPTIVAFRGTEGFSKLFRFEIGLLLKDGKEIDLDAATTEAAVMTIHTGPDEPDQVISGIFAAVEHLHAWQEQSLYRAILVPTWWKATLSHHSRVFVDRDLKQILEEVLAASDIEKYDIKLDGTYGPYDHVMQYQESNYAFLARMMEREGVYYYFEHGAEGDTLVITDSVSYHDTLDDKPVPYEPMAGGSSATANESFSLWMCRRNMLSAEVTLTDYDYMKPSLALEGSEAIEHAGKVVVYGDNFKTTSEGSRLAKVRAEEQLSRARVFHGTGRVFNMCPGFTFNVEGHPKGDFNATYLCVEVRHEGNQSAKDDDMKRLLGIESDDEYSAEVVAIPEGVQYRPPHRTPKPRVEGMIHALVDGPADSSYAQLDAEGRYHVRLMLDESGYDDGAASMWVRMLQWHAGGTEGVHFPLRKGTEVLISFIGGDPDRPFIAGAIPNPQKPSPVTSGNHTMNILITGGSNYLSMEDAADKQWIDISTPTENTWVHLGKVVDDRTHEIVLNTDANALFNIGAYQDIEVGADLYEHVVGDVGEYYDSDQDSEVAGDQTLEVGGDRDIEVGGDQTVEIGGDFDTEVGGDITLEGGGDYDTEISGDITFENGGDFDVEVGGDITWEGGGDCDTEISGDITFENGGDYVIDCSGNFDGTFGANWNCTITGTKDEKVLGDCKWLKTGTFVGIDLSASTQLKLSADAILSLGAKAEIAVSVEAALKLSLALEAVIGVKIECDMAAKINVEAGGNIKTTMNKIAGNAILKMDNVGGLRMLSAPLVLVA